MDGAELTVRLANGCKATPSQLPRILSKEQKSKECQVTAVSLLLPSCTCYVTLHRKLKSRSHSRTCITIYRVVRITIMCPKISSGGARGTIKRSEAFDSFVLVILVTPKYSRYGHGGQGE